MSEYEATRERERQDARDRAARLDRLGAEVAALMPGWRCEIRKNGDGERSPGVYLVHEDGRAMDMRHHWQKKERVVIGPAWPAAWRVWERLRDEEKPADITVAADRPAAKVVAEIERRFLPRFTEAWNLMAERENANQQRLAEQDAIRERFKARFGLGFQGHNRETCLQDTFWPTRGVSPSCRIKIEYRGRVDLEFDGLSAELAEHLLSELSTWIARERA